MDALNVKWVATLSNGTTASQHEGSWKVIPGERTPWYRLTEYLHGNNLYLTSLRLNIDGRTIHMPRANFTKFGMENASVAPIFYSLKYIADLITDVGTVDGQNVQQHFVDLTAHYQGFNVHYVQEVTNGGNNGWVVVTDATSEDAPLAPTPKFDSGVA